MTDDKVYPASKPPVINAAAAAATTTTTNPTFPANKAQLYNANRPPYRPPPNRRHHRTHSRGCCCRCCCWTIFVLILLLLIAAAVSAVVYLIYKPQRPNFTVSSLKVSSLNLTSSTRLVTAISLSVIARNPNKNVGFAYDATDITVYRTSRGDDDVVIGEGTINPFIHGKKNTTLLKSTIGSPKQDLDELSATKLKADLKAKRGVTIKIVLNTRTKVKMGSVKSPKSGVRVTCEGIRATAPTGKTATTATTSNVKCKVDLRIKIWKFTF